MTTFKCPNCRKDIDLIGQKELTEEYGLGPNPVAHQRQLGLFPEPVLMFGNRNMWLRSDIEAYAEAQSVKKIAALVEDFDRTIQGLPETEQKRARRMLAERAK